jgi:hypothetical protein
MDGLWSHQVLKVFCVGGGKPVLMMECSKFLTDSEPYVLRNCSTERMKGSTGRSAVGSDVVHTEE